MNREGVRREDDLPGRGFADAGPTGGRVPTLRRMKDDQTARVHERLARCPELLPVALGECVDPDSLTVSGERRLRLRLGATLPVGTWPVGTGALGVASLYVHPLARR